MSSYLVEDSWILSISAIKKDLKRIRVGEEVNGQITLHNGNKTMQTTYWNENKNGENYLAVAIPNAVEPKEIKIKTIYLTYGCSNLLECPQCHKPCFKLFIHPEVGKGWKCAKCHKLKYHLQSFNLYSILGISIYRMDQFDKFCVRKKPRFFYAGKPTKPLLRSIHKLQKIGMIKEAQELTSQIREYRNISQRVSILSAFLRKSGDIAVGRTNL